MTIANLQNAGSGNGTAFYGGRSSWTLTLSFTPTQGNALLVFLNVVSGTVTGLTYNGSAMTQIFAGGVSNANVLCYGISVPASPPSTVVLTFSSNANQFASVIQEVSGLTSFVADQTAFANGTGATYSSGTTFTTTSAIELWENAYAYYNASTGNDPSGTSPTNGYGLLNSGIPVKFTDTGWIWTTGAMSTGSPLTSSGLLMAYKMVTSTGAAGGSISDLSVHTNTWFGAALTFAGPAGLADVALIDLLNGGTRRYPPYKGIK